MSPRLTPDAQDEAVYVLLDAAPSPVVAVDAEGTIDYLNDRAASVLGYRPDELLGRGVEVLVPEDLRVAHHRFRDDYAVTPVARSVGLDEPLKVRRKDGSVFPAEISLMPLQTHKRLWVVTTIYDVTERERREQRVRGLNRSYLALAQLNEAIVRAPDELTLFRETCRIAVEQGDYLGAWVSRRGPGNSVVAVARAGVLDDYIDQLDVTLDPGDPRGHGPTALSFREGTIQFTTELPPDSATGPWRELSAAYGVRSAVAVPLRRGGRTAVVVTMYSEQRDAFDDQMRAVLPGAAEDLSYALDAFDAAARLEQVARERTELSARIVDAQEEERARIAADVHDDSVQTLAAVRLRLEVLRKRLETELPELAPVVVELQDTVSAVGDGLRDLLFALESADAERPLDELVEEATRHVFADTDVVPVVRVGQEGPTVAPLSETQRRQALRIVKEALVNARKHSGATHVEVVLAPGTDGLEVSVHDDGVGFDPARTRSPGHRGLTTMQDRAAVVGGWCRLERDETGMTVRFWLPYAQATAEAPPDEMAPGY